MAKKYFSETQNRTPRPRSKRLRALGGAAAGGSSTIVSVTSGVSELSGDGHTHTNKAALDEISTDDDRYLYLTKTETPEDSESVVLAKEKVKAGYADTAKEADKAKEAKYAELADDALHADEADDSKKWNGHKFEEYLDQPVRKSDEVAFQGIESGSGFEEGLLGKGFKLHEKSDGKTRLEVDELLVRMKAYFASLEIRELSYVGGNYVFSSAGSRIHYVERVSDGWKCYFYSDDGSTSTMNCWKVGDQARCQTFNIEEGTHTSASNKYYWRKVTAVGSGRLDSTGTDEEDNREYQWAILSDTDFDGDDVPEAGDRIVQMGSRNIESRQGLIYLVVEGDNAPAIMEYSGVGAEYPYYALPEPTLLLSPKKNIIHGEFHSVAYGEGGSGSIDQQLQELTNLLDEVKAQTDQKMDIWFYPHSPLPTHDNTGEANAPASDWQTADQKAMHIHDLFYDTSRGGASTGGRAWKWLFEDGQYFWKEVTDQDTLAALEKIADVASDGILSGGAEKSRVLVDWNACVSEYGRYVSQAEEFKEKKPELISESLDAYKTAFIALGTMLNGGTAWEAADGTPSWLANIHEDTTIPDPENYRETWAVYYSTLSALLKAITDTAKALAIDAQEAADDAQETARHRMQFFVTEPTTPYNIGDMWLDGAVIKVCTQARVSSESFHSEDWKEFTDYSTVQDPRILIAAFANAYYKAYKAKLNTSGSVKLFLNSPATNAAIGSIKYDAENNGFHVSESGSNSWLRPSTINADSTLAASIVALFHCMGTSTLTIYKDVPVSGMKQYDITIRTVTYYDHFKNENIEGKCEILMYNGTCWEVLQESVTAMIDNLGDMLRLLVFGSDGKNDVDTSGLITKTTFNDLFSQKVTTDENGLITNINKSGLLTKNDFATLYSEAIAKDGTVVKRSEITAFVKQDENGYLQSGVKIKADNIELEGIVSANRNFKIDDVGNMIAANATVTGTLNAKSGKIGGFWVNGTGLTNQNQDANDEENYGKFNNDAYIIFRNDDYKCFAGIGGNVLSASSGARGVARFENEDSSNHWGLGTNYALLVSAKNADENEAIHIGGGCISRLAVKTQTISSNGSINAGTGSVAFVNSGEITTRLPDVFHYDDGHVVKLKNMNGSVVKICPGTSERQVRPSSLYWYSKGFSGSANYYDSSSYKATILSNKNPRKIEVDLLEGYTLSVQQWRTNDEGKTLSTLTSSDGFLRNDNYTGKGTKTINCEDNCGTVVIILSRSSGAIMTDSTGIIRVKYDSYIHADQGDILTKDAPDDLRGKGDAAEYVFHRELYIKKDNKYYYGCWVQYKHPRDW